MGGKAMNCQESTLEGQLMVVVGGSAGIGYAVAQAVIDAGAEVVCDGGASG